VALPVASGAESEVGKWRARLCCIPAVLLLQPPLYSHLFPAGEACKIPEFEPLLQIAMAASPAVPHAEAALELRISQAHGQLDKEGEAVTGETRVELLERVGVPPQVRVPYCR
jgi:hypothetical protein